MKAINSETYVILPVQEVRRLRDTETAARELLRALRSEIADPSAGIAASIVTQHHIDRLAELL